MPAISKVMTAPARAGSGVAVAGLPHPLLEVRGLAAGYGRIQALFGVDLHVAPGQLVTLVGANGAGKTTLLRTLSGVMSASAGTVRLFGRDVTTLRADLRVRLGLAQVPEGRQVFAGLSVEDNIRLGAYTRRDAGRADDLARMYAMFPALRDKRVALAGTLSGGQQQMLAMARALMSRPRVLLLDEPSMGLAPLLVQEIFACVARLREAGLAILLVEQNAQAALSIADHGYVMEAGHIVASGPGQGLLHDDRVRQAYLGM